jgi:subtilisin family serine protease
MFTKISRTLNVAIAALLIVALFATAQPATAKTAILEIDQNALYVPGEVVVGFTSTNAGVVAAQASALAGSVNAQVVEQYGNKALLSFDVNANVVSLAGQLSNISGVSFAEPNYIYRIPEPIKGDATSSDFIMREGQNGSKTIVPMAALKAMRTLRGGRVQATYPSDPNTRTGWYQVAANIVWTNATPSVNVCVIDTGVDYTHKDLTGKIIKGLDFVNNDIDPMDDFGHGTHVAGIIAAVQNNAEGIAGVAYNAKVVAVKALDAQGSGTNWDVSMAVSYCANRLDVKVINMSLGGPASELLEDAVESAVNTSGKLIVAAAGNSDTDDPTYAYPAAYSTMFPDKVLAVAASGMQVCVDYDGDGICDYYYMDYYCKASYSNYGSWVDVIGPGTNIYSTTPWDKPFAMNFNYGYSQRYASMSGTSMAAPFVAAVAARAWGYLPLGHPKVLPAVWTNGEVGAWIKDAALGSYHTAYSDGGACWPASMDGKPMANVASALERGGLSASAVDAYTGLPLDGATVSIYKPGTTTLVGSALITKYVYTYVYPNYTYTYTYFRMGTDIINLPAPALVWADYIGVPRVINSVWTEYMPKISKPGYTISPQAAFVGWWNPDGTQGMYSGYTYGSGIAAVPPNNGNIAVVSTWTDWYNDFDQIVWLPNPAGTFTGQPAAFIVHGHWGQGNIAGLSPEGTGSLGWFPFARQMYESARDWWNWESTSIRKRTLSALPYYNGVYEGQLTDYGQFYDVNSNGIEDPGEPPLLQSDSWYGINDPDNISMFVWKDGAIKVRSDKTDVCGNGEHWWKGVRITSNLATVTYTKMDECSTGTFPYGSFSMPPIPIYP